MKTGKGVRGTALFNLKLVHLSEIERSKWKWTVRW